jgi:hypothetical protein
VYLSSWRHTKLEAPVPSYEARRLEIMNNFPYLAAYQQVILVCRAPICVRSKEEYSKKKKEFIIFYVLE